MPNPNNGRRIEYRRIRDLQPDDRNPKAHDFDLLDGSVGRFGYVEPIVEDGRTGKIISGHGRTIILGGMEERGAKIPDGIEVDDDGAWLAPVTVGWASKNDQEASAALIALNRAGEKGGWENDALAEILADLATLEDGLLGVGYSEDDIDALIADTLDAAGGGTGGGGDAAEYTARINAPQYQITGARPEPEDLVDTSKADSLREQIEAADLPEDVRTFLLTAAGRHNVFRYDRIAEFYAHADPDLQRLMEASALVIIDFNDAIAGGYVRLSSRLATLLDVERAERGEDVLTFESEDALA